MNNMSRGERTAFCWYNSYHFLLALLAISASLVEAAESQQQSCEVGQEDEGLCVDDECVLDSDIATCKDAREACQEWAELGTQFAKNRYNVWSKLGIV